MNEKITELPLEGKYLKYSPEITFDIFKLVWDKLISLGYHSSNSLSAEYRYEEFKEEYPYFRETANRPLEFNCFGTSHNFKETTVQEILGYNPFIKETIIAKDWNNVTEEELLEEAKRRYPIGCKVKLIGTNTGSDFKNEVRFTKYKFYGNSKEKQLCIDGNLLLFHEGIWAEIESIPEVETKEVIPEYIECIKPQSVYFIPGNIYKVLNAECISSCRIISNIRCSHYEAGNGLYVSLQDTSYFKPSTKEAFEAQNQPKPIKEWSVGSYVVAINDGHARGKSVDKYKIGFIDVITNKFYDETIGLKFSSNCCNNSDFKWFATKPEAEEFAKTLIKPIEDTIECEKCSGTGEVMTAKLYPNGHTEVNEECPVCGGEGIIYKPKQSLKQAVHCTTQEEWDFVLSKFNPRKLSNTSFTMYSDSLIITTDESNESNIGCYGSVRLQQSEYQILSFQEWCGLNEYKMESKQPLKQMDKSRIFEVGDYVVITKSNINWITEMDSEIGKVVKITNIDSDGYINYKGKPSQCFGACDNHFRHATQEEIEDLKTASTGFLDESYIGKFISFNCGKCFYDEALIIKENGYIYLLNNCHDNNDGHSDKSIYKYSLKFMTIDTMLTQCKDIKFLDFKDNKFKPLTANDLIWEIDGASNLVWGIDEATDKIKLTYLPEPD